MKRYFTFKSILGRILNLNKTQNSNNELYKHNPKFNTQVPDPFVQNNFSRNYKIELGLGLASKSGKHFVLMPTFTFSGGFLKFNDIETIINNIRTTSDLDIYIQSFNLGQSIAYRFK